MALTTAAMKAAIKSQLQAQVGPAYANPADDHELGGFDIDTYFDKLASALADAIVPQITSNANATGVDSGGDTHNLAIV